MSQSNLSSSSDHIPPDAAKSGASRKYVVLFAVLVLAAAIFYFSTVKAREPGLSYSPSETTAMPAAAHSAAGFVSPLQTIYAKKQVGECFDFGRYPQGANGEIKPITWRVLRRNADNLLVIAEQGLDCKPFNTEFFSIDWADCTLRDWLNSEFYDKAFNEQEHKCILKTSVVNDGGAKTKDYVFLLSVDEARSLFANDSARRAKPTEYAKNNGAYTYSGCCWWWLRSHGDYDSRAAYVVAVGFVGDYGYFVTYERVTVRPAVSVAL